MVTTSGMFLSFSLLVVVALSFLVPCPFVSIDTIYTVPYHTRKYIDMQRLGTNFPKQRVSDTAVAVAAAAVVVV